MAPRIKIFDKDSILRLKLPQALMPFRALRDESATEPDVPPRNSRSVT
jgi:hypothetical protein